LDTTFARELIDIALAEGADEAEVYVRTSKNLSVEVKGMKIDTVERSDSTGYSVRVFREHRLGFSYSTDPGDMHMVAKQAVAASQFAEPDECNSLPDETGASDVDIYDKTIETLSEQDAISIVLSMEKATLDKDARIKKTRSASGSFIGDFTRIINSKGIDSGFRSTSCYGSIMAVAEDGIENQVASEYSGSRYLKDINFRSIGETAAKKALQLLGAVRISPFKGFILLDPAVAADFLGILSSALSSEAVQKKKSLLAGRAGKQVMSGMLNVVDSGLLAGRLGSRPVDGEGVPTREKKMVENGILKGYLYNTYTALKDGTISSGNASRGGFTGVPGVGITNLFLSAVSDKYTKDFSSLVAMTDRGIYVTDTMGMHTANPISGEYSVGISGIGITNGRLSDPVRETVISGNILDLFSNIICIGEEILFYGNIGASYILVGNIDISG
jgi:PmbA protein